MKLKHIWNHHSENHLVYTAQLDAKLFQNIWAHLPWSNARGKCYGIMIFQPLRHSREWTSSVLFVFETFRNGAAPEPVPKVSRRTTCKKVPTILRTFRRAKTLTHCGRTTYILYILIANCNPTNLRYMPNDPCFDWKRPCFGRVDLQTIGVILALGIYSNFMYQ